MYDDRQQQQRTIDAKEQQQIDAAIIIGAPRLHPSHLLLGFSY
jgi:hypothetical protein